MKDLVYTVRRAQEADIDDMIDLGVGMHAESAFRNLNYDKEKCRSLVKMYLDSPEDRFFSVAESDGVLVGMFAGYITDYYFGHGLLANDILWYVRPENRGSRVGLALLKAFEDWALERGVSEVCLGVSTAVDLERTAQILSNRGYHHVGGNFKLSALR